MEFLTESFAWIVDFLSNDSDTSFFAQIQAYIFITWMEAQLFLMNNAWNVAKAVLDTLNMSTSLNTAFAGIDPSIAAFMSVLKIPDAMNLLIQAHVTRWVLVFMRL